MILAGTVDRPPATSVFILAGFPELFAPPRDSQMQPLRLLSALTGSRRLKTGLD